MSIFIVATVIVYVTSVLTSSVNGIPATDTHHSSSSGLKSIFETSNPSNGSATSLQKDEKPLTIMSEAGPIPSNQNASFAKPVVGVKDVSLSPSDVGSKTSQIKARKGVGNESEPIENASVGLDRDVVKDIQKIDQVSLPKNVTDGAKTSAVTTESVLNKNETSNSKTPEKNQSDGVAHLPLMIVPGIGNKTSVHIPKPTVTSGEGNDDGEGMPSSATQTEFGMPKKVDYVIPVVITIMATPILGIAAYILYTRGRDCWDKRHYRRMDFLIEGMYND